MGDLNIASGFDPSRIGDQEFDSEYVICPNCGEKQGDCWEWVKDYPRADLCPGCGAALTVWAEHEVTYYTELSGPPNPSSPTPETPNA